MRAAFQYNLKRRVFFRRTNMFILCGIIGLIFATYESYKLIRKKVPSLAVTIILATLVNAFVHEAPNIFAWEWVYTIPYVTFEILQINIVIIVGWVILIAVPIIADKIAGS